MEFGKLATLADHEAGAELNILSPVNGSPTDVFIKIKGPDSKEWRREKKRQTSKIIQAKSEGKMDELDYESMDIEALISITISWKNITKGGKPFKCTSGNAKELYMQSPSIVNQLLNFLSDGENFTKG